MLYLREQLSKILLGLGGYIKLREEFSHQFWLPLSLTGLYCGHQLYDICPLIILKYHTVESLKSFCWRNGSTTTITNKPRPDENGVVVRRRVVSRWVDCSMSRGMVRSDIPCIRRRSRSVPQARLLTASLSEFSVGLLLN